MSTPSDEPNPSASNNDSPPRSKLAEILRISIKTVPLILTFSLLTWALVRYGERSSGEVGTLCNSRSQQSSGFGGDSDFYGLGIRLGLYLQWASSFITNWFTPTEREPVVVTYIIFNLSITMAVLARVFGQQCTFVAEMFVVLTMFWGGLNVILLVPLLRGISTDRYHEISPKDRENALQILKTSQSLKWASNLSNCFMSPITIWFWARLVVVGQQDFATTPGQTSLFFFARIQGQGVRALSIFMTVASVINFLWFNWLLFPLEVDLDLQNKNLERILGGLVWGPLNTLLIPVCILFELATVLTMILMSVLTFTLGLLFGAIALARAHNVLFNPDVSGTPDLSGPVDVPDKTEQSTMRLIRIHSGVPLLLSLWCIVGIELTLHWNSVTGIYSINTTGQIIPLVAGIGVLLVSLSKATEPGHRDLGWGYSDGDELSTNEGGADYESLSNGERRNN